MTADITYIQVVTFAIALVGAVLGVLNTWNTFSRQRVRLRVTPKVAVNVGNGIVLTGHSANAEAARLIADGKSQKWCIEITNLSDFPLTISNVGFGKAEKGERRLVLVLPDLSAGKKWPPRLEPRESVTAYGSDGDPLPADVVIDCPYAYAETDCGHIAYGTSAILKHCVNELKNSRD